jgi:UDP-glucose 4-epimerase
MAVLVTGGKGFLGAAVIRHLVRQEHDVVCLDRKTTPGRLEPILDRVTMLGGGIPDVEEMVDLLRRHQIDRIAHMVFFISRPESAGEIHEEVAHMVMATAVVYEAARRVGLKAVVFPSSIHVFGPQWLHGEVPLHEDSPALAETLYGTGKKFNETVAGAYAARSGMNIVALRVPAVYGPGAKVGARGVNAVAVEAALGRPVIIPYPPDQRVCLAHVEDVGNVIVSVLLADHPNHRVYNIGGHTVSYWALAAIVRRCVPDAEITFAERDVVSDLPYLIDERRIREEFGLQHRSLRDGYVDLIDDSRRSAGFSSLVQKGAGDG